MPFFILRQSATRSFLALEHLLEWPEIARSPQLAVFAAYIVGRTLDGEQQAIKAYSIVVDVFGRGAGFDPQADPIVRVQARRLRALLGAYYQGAGASEPVRIKLPVGRYIPEFELVADRPELPIAPVVEDQPGPAAPKPRGSITLSRFALAVIALGTAAIAFSTASGSRARRPKLWRRAWCSGPACWWGNSRT
ncbi:hypothetical protein N8D56_10815 [Devosia sp. A8/3-2]|nr:hypothetical protein N8D56_10815 [Devosia sp. A8/3-2]